jgi:hypothetical protein
MHDSRIVSLSFLALNESLATVMSLAVNYGEAPNLFREDMNISKEASWIMGEILEEETNIMSLPSIFLVHLRHIHDIALTPPFS